MSRRFEILDLSYDFGGMEQHLFPVVLFGQEEVVLVDCGYPGSLELLEAQLRIHNIQPEALTRLVLTHQDDDHMGAAAELKEAYPSIKISASHAEAPYISGACKNLRLQQGEALQDKLPEEQKAFGQQFCDRYRHLRLVLVDAPLFPGEQFDWGGGCEILETAGHTPGHISIRAADNAYMITGDAAVIEGEKLAIANPEYCLDPAAAEQSLNQLLQYNSCQYICYHGGVLKNSLE
ncbi:MBL fold metallo-hydrolase [Intestinimonas sp.]|uniref:MBL fold metallo-hydrolase n=1 Tax=Intestinimonas sp. TaxID=1965293 RepID=UPI00261B0DD0|nr:MBL fold metallo-hydrolase [Intestinimonas sp.]